MGAWGAEAFENDTALDWLAELEESADDSALREAIGQVTTVADGGDIDSDVAAIALAAAEVVAAAKGRPATALPEELAGWLEEVGAGVGDDLPNAARGAVERVAARSELKDLWDETGESGWHDSVGSLRARLAAIAGDGLADG